MAISDPPIIGLYAVVNSSIRVDFSVICDIIFAQMTTEINRTDYTPSDKKRRILFVITQSEMGGAQQFIGQLVSHIDKSRFSCSVVVGSEGDDNIKSILPTDTQYIKAEYLRRNPSILSDILSLFELRKIFRAQAPDIIFLNSSKAGFNGSIAARALLTRLEKTTVIYRIGGWSFNDPQPSWKSLFYKLLEKISARWKDYIIVNNKKDFDDAKRLKIRPQRKILLIHNGIDPYMEFMDKSEAREMLSGRISKNNKMKYEISLSPTDFVAGTVANFYPSKDLSSLIKAAKKSPNNIKFVVIGDGQLREKLEEEIESYGLEKRVFLVGRVSRASQYMTAFDVFILPSVKEGFPWTILEAMSARIPVIASNVGAMAEIIENRKNGMSVVPKKPDQISDAIKTLMQDEKLRDEITIQAHQTVIRRFNIHSMIEQYERLFSSS
jgi:glycosyltransferase involved in cell wall biosynthesis